MWADNITHNPRFYCVKAEKTLLTRPQTLIKTPRRTVNVSVRLKICIARSMTRWLPRQEGKRVGEADQRSRCRSSVIQPFRNHKIEFDPPRITEKPPLFSVDKWLDKQNDQIAKRFTSIVRKIESLYMQDAERQVKAAQKNVLADYRELNQLLGDYESLTDSSHQ